ncbi:hypothetical protein [Streptacidiphilus carbonis]|uniref:hypothetical protein n=1 Tax=Streptacidiphilus carbonis TaxID=105422 RepID=UPI0005AA37EA|nr:hypothetical protein [Streptacidiphilus carbonis]
MTAYERMRRLAQVLDEHRRTVPVAVAPSGTAVVELGDSALLWRLTAADGTHRDERVLSPAPVDACVHLPDRGEIVWIADTADGVRAAAADAGDGRPLRRSLLPQWAAENWTDLVAADLNGRQTALLLVEPSAGRCLVDPFSGAVAAHWAAAEAEQDAEVAAFAARGEHWWRWERRVGVRPSYTLHDDAGRSQEFPGVLLDVRGTCSLWSVPARGRGVPGRVRGADPVRRGCRHGAGRRGVAARRGPSSGDLRAPGPAAPAGSATPGVQG